MPTVDANPIISVLRLFQTERHKLGRRLAEKTAGRKIPEQPVVRYPCNTERDFLQNILVRMNPLVSMMHGDVVPQIDGIMECAGVVRQDATYGDDVVRMIGGMRVAYETRFPAQGIDEIASKAAHEVADHTRREVARQTKAVIGLEVLPAEPWLEGTIDSFVKENVKLIKSIPDKYFADIETMVLRQIRGGRRASEIEDDIIAMKNVPRHRAALIARDQIGKLTSQMMMTRHQDLGMKRYRWRTSRDERVRGNPGGKYPKARPSHHRREGKIYRYKKPPEGGHPGEAIRCRCWAEPVFEDILGPEFGVDLTPAPVSGPKRKRRKKTGGMSCPYANR